MGGGVRVGEAVSVGLGVREGNGVQVGGNVGVGCRLGIAGVGLSVCVRGDSISGRGAIDNHPMRMIVITASAIMPNFIEREILNFIIRNSNYEKVGGSKLKSGKEACKLPCFRIYCG